MPLAPVIQSGSLLKYYQALWAPLYEGVLELIGSTGTILPIGDPSSGQPNATTFTTRGEEQVTFTWSEAPSAFDTPLDLTSPDSFQGIIPIIFFNASDEEADSPDVAYWTRGDDNNDFAFSLGMWTHITNTASVRSLMTKWDGAQAIQEWQWTIRNDDVIRLTLRDDSAPQEVFRSSDSAITQGAWAFQVVTYDGAGGSAAMDGVTIYQDGSSIASTVSNNASYVAMEDGTSTLNLGAVNNAGANFFNGRIAGGPLGPFFTQTELSADAVAQLYILGRGALGV